MNKLTVLRYIATPKGIIYLAIASVLADPIHPYAFFAESGLEVYLFIAGFQDFFVRTVQLIFRVYEYNLAGGVTSIGYILLNPSKSIPALFHPHCGGHIFMIPIWVGCIGVYMLQQAGAF